MEERTKVVIYARVSTSTQDYTRQITELRNYAWKQNYEIVKEFSEKISGGKKVEERTAIKEMLDFVKFNRVDKVLIYECSRLSRRQLDFLSIIEQLTELGVSLFILQNGFCFICRLSYDRRRLHLRKHEIILIYGQTYIVYSVHENGK